MFSWLRELTRRGRHCSRVRIGVNRLRALRREACLRCEPLEQRLTPVTISPGDLLIADATAFDGGGGVIRVNPTTGAQAAVSSGGTFRGPGALAVTANGDLFISNDGSYGGPCPGGCSGVIRVNPATGAQTTVSFGSMFRKPTGLSVAANSDVFVVDQTAFGGNGGVIRVNPTTGTQVTVSSGGNFRAPYGIALAADGNLLIADQDAVSSGAVLRVNPATGAQGTVSSGGFFGNPSGIAVAANGDILIGDSQAVVPAGAVIRVNPTTGAQAAVSSGGSFDNPIGIAVASNGDLFVANWGARIVRVNPMTGAQAIVSSGGLLSDSSGIAIANFLAFAAPSGNGADNLVLRRSGTNLELLDNGMLVAAGPLALTQSVVLQGADGENDTLMIDFSGGSFSIPGGIRFHGGAGGGDIIAVVGDINATLSNASLVVSGSASLSVFLTGVESGHLVGGVGNNILNAAGFTGPTALSGDAGNDQLIAGSGGSLMAGGPGNDTLVGGAGSDLLLGGDNDDNLAGGAGTDLLDGAGGADSLQGEADNDILTGGPGNDLLNGGPGNDLLVEQGDVNFTLTDNSLSGMGTDALNSIEAAALVGGAGDNTFHAAAFTGQVILIGDGGNDLLVGGANADLLIGGAGNDTLLGGDGSDLLFAGEGDDSLDGGSGVDLLDGGLGFDTGTNGEFLVSIDLIL